MCGLSAFPECVQIALVKESNEALKPRSTEMESSSGAYTTGSTNGRGGSSNGSPSVSSEGRTQGSLAVSRSDPTPSSPAAETGEVREAALGNRVCRCQVRGLLRTWPQVSRMPAGESKVLWLCPHPPGSGLAICCCLSGWAGCVAGVDPSHADGGAAQSPRANRREV